MLNIIHILYTILPIIAATSITSVLLYTAYTKIRRKFSVSVNCWFCNTWTKVAYDNRDSFDCPNCLQYNGFTKDGDYNKAIPEQRDEFMNKGRPSAKTSQHPPNNGLCKLCNNNQQLKIYQLAHFVPLVESNYDIEIDHFQAQLEKAYKLCKKCDRVLKETIGKQNAWLFGKHLKTVCNNGISAVTKLSENVKKSTPESFLITTNRILSIITAVAAFLVILSTYKLFLNFVPKTYTPLLRNFSLPRVVNLEKIYLSKTFRFQPFIAICSFGLFLHGLATIFEKSAAAIKLNRFLCWIILILASWVNKSYTLQILLVQVFCCGYLIFSAFSKSETKKLSNKTRSKTINKFVRNLEKTCSDFSDLSDFEDLSSAQNISTSSSQSNTSRNQSNNTSLYSPPPTSTYNTAKSAIHPPSRRSDFESLRPSFDSELNTSLNNLRLGSMGFKQPARTSPVFTSVTKRPKPVLSPPKFVNSWVASSYPPNRASLSRSSSESSGFGSQHDTFAYSQPYQTREYDFGGCSPRPGPFLPLAASQNFKNNTFYPNLNQNKCLFLQGDRNFVNSNAGFSSRFSSVSANDEFTQSYHKPSLFKTWSENFDDPTVSFKDLSLQSNSFFRNS